MTDYSHLVGKMVLVKTIACKNTKWELHKEFVGIVVEPAITKIRYNGLTVSTSFHLPENWRGEKRDFIHCDIIDSIQELVVKEGE